ncbi:MAG: Hsp20/alpha crystallin family protein [Gammaproteobacteria bacterium]|nr:Hsp20/alpha crystallin family protein [Gammaproteobacteria bacterium]
MSVMINKELSEIVEQLFGGANEPLQQSIWRPRADVYRYAQGWLIKLELAGVGLDDIQVNLSNENLKIEGIRRDLIANEVKQSYRMEISYNRFERVIELPEKLRDAQVSVDFNQGMLMIHVQEGSNVHE